uniref:APRL8 n=1 Tax=Arundo donax TaxID=35708 RepID=A0A0A9DAG4_ARUDO
MGNDWIRGLAEHLCITSSETFRLEQLVLTRGPTSRFICCRWGVYVTSIPKLSLAFVFRIWRPWFPSHSCLKWDYVCPTSGFKISQRPSIFL